MQRQHRFIQAVFFGNYFYGICTVGLSIEASLQQHFPANPLLYYVLLFAATVLYYTKAYITEIVFNTYNKRSLWYIHNKKIVFYSQLFLTGIALCCIIILLKNVWQNVWQQQKLQWVLWFIFPLVAALYYGINNKTFGKYNLRNTGWMKPFVIGFVWAGWVTTYPILFYCLQTNTPLVVTLIGCLLFLKNFMFVTVLCIMFDIKDYAADHNHQLKTFVVRVGLRKTIFYILLPLCILGLGTFLIYATSHQFSTFKILLNMVPFILLITVAYSMHRRHPILYYLAIIDGLMLVKAICGITAMLYF